MSSFIKIGDLFLNKDHIVSVECNSDGLNKIITSIQDCDNQGPVVYSFSVDSIEGKAIANYFDATAFDITLGDAETNSENYC